MVDSDSETSVFFVNLANHLRTNYPHQAIYTVTYGHKRCQYLSSQYNY